MPRDALVLTVAKTQFGLVSRQQALKAGISAAAIDYRVANQLWERIERGVYRLPGASGDWYQRAMALCLAAYPWAVISHESAAWLWKLDGVSREPPEPIDVLVKKGKGLAAPGARVRLTNHFEGVTRTRQGIPITALSRTLVDLAATISATRLERALDSAWRMGPRAHRAIAERVSRLAPRAHPGLATLKNLIRGRDGSTDSELETRMRQLIWASGLPCPKHNFHVFRGKKWLGKFDFVWPKLELVVQCHGLKYHLVASRFRRDQVQQSELSSMGWTVITVTWHQVTPNPAALLDRLRRTFEMLAKRTA